MHSPDNTVEANSEELMDFEINNTGADSSSTQLDTLAKQTDQLAKKKIAFWMQLAFILGPCTYFLYNVRSTSRR